MAHMTPLEIPPQLLLEHLLDATTDTAIAVVDTALKVAYLNPIAADFFQCSPEDVIGRSVRDIHLKTQQSREHFDQAVNRIQAGEAFEYRIEQSVNNGLRYLGIRVSGLREDKHLVGYLFIARDITQRHLAELTLAKEEEHYRNLYEQAPVPYHSLDIDGRIRHVNNAWLDTFGYPAEGIVGRSLFDLLIEPEAKVFARAFERFKHIGEIHEVEFTLRHADGRAISVLLFGRAVYTESGQFHHTHCILIDVTAQREMEHRLNRSEMRYRNLFEKMRDALLLFGAETLQIEDANQAVTDLLGYSRDELMGMTPFELSAEPDKGVALLERTGHGEGLEIKVQRRNTRHKDGRIIPVELVATSFELEGRSKLLGAMRDISNKVSLEQELENQRLQLTKLLETIPYGIEETDLQGSIIYANPAYHHLFGYEHGELLGQSVWSMMLDDEVQRMKRLIRTRLYEEQPAPETIYAKARRKDGREIEIQIDWDYRREADGNVTGTISVITDVTQRNRTAQALRDSEARLRSIFDNAGASISIADLSGRVLSVNKAMCNFLGYSREELLSMNFSQFAHPDEHTRSLELFRQAAGGSGENYLLEKRYLRKDGSIRSGLLSTTLVCDDIGRPSYVIGLIQDISDRIKAEKALRENQELFSLFMDNLPGAVSIKDAEGRMLFVNRFLEQHFDTKTWIGKTTGEIFPGEPGRIMQEDDQKALLMGRHELVEKLTERDGLEHTYHSYKFAIPRQGRPALIGGIAMDLSEQLKTKRELELTRFALDRAGEAVFWVDQDSRFVYANDATCRSLGYSHDELMRMAVPDIDPNFPPEACEALRKRIKTEGTIRLESTYRRKDGSEFPIGITANYLMFDDQEYNCVIVRDVSEQKRIQQERQQAHKMEALGQLTGGIAHDFNNILASIMGFAELSLIRLDNNQTDKLASSIKEILIASRRGKSLVDQMLRFSRGDGSKPQPLQLQPIVHEVIKLLRSTLPSSILIEAQVDANTPQIMGDPVQMHQALMNLCINARDAMDGKGVLTISLRLTRDIEGICDTCHAKLSGDWVELSVSDNGVGIPRAFSQRIFDPFFTTKELGKGTGMGLAVVHGIMIQHQGHVQIGTREGVGTDFHLLFPVSGLSDYQETSQTASVVPNARKPLQGKVLVVDDEPAVLKVICALLEHEGLETRSASDSEAALDLFRQSPQAYDLLVVDQTMPKLTGTELVLQIKRLRPDLPIILCSGHSDQISEDNIADYGIDRYLRKPVERATLIETLRALFNYQR
jgi:PAS domain S-box-containing protein